MNKSLMRNSFGSKFTVFIFALLCGVTFLQNTTSVNAADPVLPIENIPGTSENNALIKCGTGGNNQECGFADLVGLIQNGLRLVFALAAFIATAMFIYAGFLMLTAVGNMNQIAKAKTIFTRSIVGFLIMFLSFILVKNLLDNIKLNSKAKDVINNVVNTE